MKNNYSIIMAGGVGSRFWPMSVPENPKQFLDILGTGKSLLRMTYERLLHVSPSENVYILTNALYKDLVLQQLPELSPSQVLTEPERKNTAPCIAYAAAKLCTLNPEARLIVAPADHLILQEQNFKASIESALESAAEGRIATIGIVPTRPDTGYGYIEVAAESTVSANAILPVQQFREKPDLATAQSFVAAGNFFWNSGIFIWKASTVLAALQEFQPALHALFAGDCTPYNTDREQAHVNAAFRACEDISVDYAIMEHAQNIDVVVASFDWSDLGTWGSLDTHLTKDAQGNSLIGGKCAVFHTQDCIVNIPEGNVAIIDGLEGYIVIQAENRLMILRKENEQELKQFLKAIE
jgi:mannose-1-phosphate guanylyltransferase